VPNVYQAILFSPQMSKKILDVNGNKLEGFDYLFNDLEGFS